MHTKFLIIKEMCNECLLVIFKIKDKYQSSEYFLLILFYFITKKP